MFTFAAAAAVENEDYNDETCDAGDVSVGETSGRFTSSQLVRDTAAIGGAGERHRTPWT